MSDQTGKTCISGSGIIYDAINAALPQSQSPFGIAICNVANIETTPDGLVPHLPLVAGEQNPLDRFVPLKDADYFDNISFYENVA